MSSKFDIFEINDDFIIFHERLELWFTVNKVTDLELKANHLLSFLSNNAYKLLKIVCAPAELKSKKYDELVAALKTQFVRKTIIFKERKKFYGAQQNEGENVLEFYNRVKSLAITCNFGENIDKVLMDKFVVGLLPGPVFERVCDDSSATTIEKCLEIAQSREINTEAVSCHKIQQRFGRYRQQQQQKHFEPHGQQQQQRQYIDKHGQQQQQQQKSKATCNACGLAGHIFSSCKYKKYKCRKCNRIGHLAKMCVRAKRFSNHCVEVEQHVTTSANNDNQNGEDGNIQDDDLRLFSMEVDPNSENFNIKNDFNSDCKLVSDNVGRLYTTTICTNGQMIQYEIDTGSAISAIPFSCFEKYFPDQQLLTYQNELRAYDGTVINTKGYFNAKIMFAGKIFFIDFVVVNNGCRPLIGRDALRILNFKFNLSVNSVSVNHRLSGVLNNFKNLFDGSLGKFQYATVNLKIKSDAKPIFFPPRPVPFAYRNKLETELERLESLGVITRVEHSDWGTPLVTVLKKDSSIRVCADYSVTINKFLEDVNYPLPRIDDLFQALQGGKLFSKIDLSQAFNQLIVDEETSKILSWSTHKGIYRVNRLPFGCKPNSAIFQAKIDSVLLGCKGTVTFIDDIVVTGRNDEEHLQNLHEVFDRLERAGFRVNQAKCSFFKEKIAYLGFIIDSEGLHKDAGKVEAIKQMPSPKDKTQAKSFCGLVLYYGRFLPGASIILKPIFTAIANEQFVWNEQCVKAMNEIKDLIISDLVLAHYNPELPLVLISDASQYGIGSCIAHKLNNGQERPIAFVSRTLNKAEIGYSMIDKEALAIYFGVCKFQQYLVGRRFTIKTDHRPLVSIFGGKKGIPVMAANRLQRWAIYLSAFDFDVQCIAGKDNGCADALSRLSLESTEAQIQKEYSYLNFISENFQKPIRCADIAVETTRDKTLSIVVNFVKNGWNDSCQQIDIKDFFVRRNELSFENGVLMWGHRAVIPERFRKVLLEEIHCSHMGIVRSKGVARSYFWWPGLDKSIEVMINSCSVCRENRQNPRRVESIPWPKSSQPFERIHIDYCGPINGENFLIIIDSFSKWLEVGRTRSITAERTIEIVRPIFARFGMPATLVSDNAASFTSFIFQKFCEVNGIKHITSAPFHPASNGQAENSVRTFKLAFKKMLVDPNNKGRCVDSLIQTFLYAYRNTAHSESGETPFKLMFGRQPSLRWKSLNPTDPINQVCHTKNKFNAKKFNINDKIYVKNFMTNKWQLGEIVEIVGFNTFIVLVSGKKYKRHADHLSACVKQKNDIKIDKQNFSNNFESKILYRDFLNKKLSVPYKVKQVISNDENFPSGNNIQESVDHNSFTEGYDVASNVHNDIASNVNNEIINNGTEVVICNRKSTRLRKKPDKLDL